MHVVGCSARIWWCFCCDIQEKRMKGRGSASGIFLWRGTGSTAAETGRRTGPPVTGSGRRLVPTGQLGAPRRQKRRSCWGWRRLWSSTKEEHQEGAEQIGSWMSTDSLILLAHSRYIQLFNSLVKIKGCPIVPKEMIEWLKHPLKSSLSHRIFHTQLVIMSFSYFLKIKKIV